MRKFAHLSVGFAAALFVIHTWQGNATALITVCCIAAAVCIALAFKRRRAGIAFLLAGIVLGVVWNGFYVKWDARLPNGIDKDSHTVVARVTDYSRKSNNGKWIVFPAEIEVVDAKRIDKKIRANVYYAEENVRLKPGDELAATASFALPENDGEFNAYTYYKARKIDAMVFAEEGGHITKCAKVPVKYFYASLRRGISNRIAHLVPKEESAFLNALIIGDKTELSEAFEEELRITGLSHTIAISGMHVSFLVGLIILLFGKRRAPFLAIPVMLVFVLIAGSTPSVIRAFIMQTFILMAPLLMQEEDRITSLFAALFIILLINPYAIGDVGLQLSFSATLGLILLSNKICNYIIDKLSLKGWNWYNKLLNFIAGTTAATLSATLFTLPLTVYYYGTVSLVSLVANIAVIWAISLLFSSGAVIILLSFVWPSAADFFAFIPAWLINGIKSTVNALAEIPFASVYAKNGFAVAGLMLLYLGIGVWYVVVKRGWRIGRCLLPASVGLCIAFLFIGAYAPASQNAEFTVFDVGQGLSVMVECQGKRVVVDCGGDSFYSGKTVYSDIIKRNTRKIDAIVLTHPHSDHVNGVEILLNKAKVNTLYIPAKCGGDEGLASIIKTAHSRKTEVIAVEQDTRLDFGDINLRMLCCYSGDNENDIGMAAIISKDDFDVVITGDLSAKSEMYLVNKKNLPDAEVYVAGHHGANEASCNVFLNKIRPEYAVISAGENNVYGHPGEDALERFKSLGISVKRTDESGTIRFASSGVFKEE